MIGLNRAKNTRVADSIVDMMQRACTLNSKMPGNDLFEQTSTPDTVPLAARMRPRTLDEFVGQDHIVGPGRLLRRAIAADQLGSIILSGPPGTGKTTLARVIAGTTKSAFISLNAVLGGVKDVRDAVAKAQDYLNLHGRKTILFVDEVHRWNKAQQDALLPWVENGVIVLIGATTENPFFEVNAALVSRSRIFRLTPLQPEHMREIAYMALRDPERGYGKHRVRLDDEALDHLIRIADGDARTLLNALQLAVETGSDATQNQVSQDIHVTLSIAEDSIQAKALLYDKEGDYHYDSISAFIKSLRGSDPDAALYWAARMIRSGEDPKYLFRRMLVFASEDVGLADSHALNVVESAVSAFERVGMPEGQFHLAHAALYLATAPKSNSTLGYFDAVKAVEQEVHADVPKHLRDGSRDAEGFGHGEGYMYPHAYRDHWVAQKYLPRELSGRVFYVPGTEGEEPDRTRELEHRRILQLAVDTGDDDSEVLSYSPGADHVSRWHYRTQESTDYFAQLSGVCFDRIKLLRHSRVLTFESTVPALTAEALRRVPEGLLVATFYSPEQTRIFEHHVAGMEWKPKLHSGFPSEILSGNRATDISALFDGNKPVFDRIILHRFFSVLQESDGCEPTLARELSLLLDLLASEGECLVVEPAPAAGQRLSALLNPGDETERVYHDALVEAEQELFSRNEDDRRTDMCDALNGAGFRVQTQETESFTRERTLNEDMISTWFNPERNGYGALIRRNSNEEHSVAAERWVKQKLTGTPLGWSSAVHLIVSSR